jgi:hypothetical protein
MAVISCHCLQDGHISTCSIVKVHSPYSGGCEVFQIVGYKREPTFRRNTCSSYSLLLVVFLLTEASFKPGLFLDPEDRLPRMSSI